LTASLLGNFSVSLGWFGTNLVGTGLHGYATMSYALLLLLAVAFNLVFFFTGLAPAGWIRPARKSE
jgi:hypothetical protein